LLLSLLNQGTPTAAELVPRITEILCRYPSLLPFLEAHPHFPLLLAHVLLHETTILTNAIVTTSELSADECTEIGRSLFAKVMKAKMGPDAGVDAWIKKHKALVEIDAAEAWFRPMVEEIAVELLSQQGLSGASVRLGTGAAVSIVDQVSDIYMINAYANTPGREESAISLALMVGLNMLNQIFVIYTQRRKGPKSRMLREIAFVLTAVKPGVDAWRVAIGAAAHEHASLEPEVEMTVTKGSEMAFESVPGCILQVRSPPSPPPPPHHLNPPHLRSSATRSSSNWKPPAASATPGWSALSSRRPQRVSRAPASARTSTAA
jgi:hypothetical protein